MYSMVLVMSMAGAPEVPQFGWHGHSLFGGKLMSCFSCFSHKSHGCTGGGGVIVTEAAPAVARSSFRRPRAPWCPRRARRR